VVGPDCQKITNFWAAFPFPSDFLPDIVPFSLFILPKEQNLLWLWLVFSLRHSQKPAEVSVVLRAGCGAEPIGRVFKRSKYHRRRIMQDSKIISSF